MSNRSLKNIRRTRALGKRIDELVSLQALRKKAVIEAQKIIRSRRHALP